MPQRSPCAGFSMVGLLASVSLLSDHWAAIEAWEPAPAPDALEEPLLKQARRCPACEMWSTMTNVLHGYWLGALFLTGMVADPRCSGHTFLCLQLTACILHQPSNEGDAESARPAQQLCFPALHFLPLVDDALLPCRPGHSWRAGGGAPQPQPPAPQHVACAPGVRIDADQLLASGRV